MLIYLLNRNPIVVICHQVSACIDTPWGIEITKAASSPSILNLVYYLSLLALHVEESKTMPISTCDPAIANPSNSEARFYDSATPPHLHDRQGRHVKPLSDLVHEAYE
jgi:hypothetical protein